MIFQKNVEGIRRIWSIPYGNTSVINNKLKSYRLEKKAIRRQCLGESEQ